MRLVAADSQRETYVAEILCDVIVEAFGLGNVGRQALRKLLSLRANFRRRQTAVFFETGIPAADLLPGFERRHLHVGTIVIRTVLLLFLVFVLGLVFAFEMNALPVI